MPEVFLEFLGDASPWLIMLLIPLYFWGKLNHDALHNRESHPESFERTINWLRENNLGLLYLKALGWLMDKVSNLIGDRQRLNQSYVTAAHPNGFIHKAFGFNPFTPESYDKCLRLALMYPVFAFFIAWALGSSGQVSSVDLLNQHRENAVILSGWQRWSFTGGVLVLMFGGLWFVRRWQGWRQWLALKVPFLLIGLVEAFYQQDNSTGTFTVIFFTPWLVFLLVFITMYVGGWSSGWLIYRARDQAHEAIYPISFAVSFALAVFFALAVADAFTGAFTVAVAVAFVGAVAGVFTGAGIIIVVLAALQKWSERKNRLGRFWLIYSILFFALGYVSLALSKQADYMILLLFWLLLPLVNAPLDWVSLGVTRGLLQAVRTGQHSSRRALGFVLADLLLALVFLFLITAVLVGVTALGNAIVGWALVDIAGILQNVRCEPTKVDHWWIYFMLLSTLVPTLLHFALAGGAATLWVPRPVRLWLADGLERDQHKTFLAWLYLTFMPVLGFVVVPGALLYFLWWLISTNDAWLGTHLLDWADMLAGRQAEVCPLPK